MQLHAHTRRAFAARDLVAVLVMVVIGGALALAASNQMRQQAIAASSLSQLRWIAGATGSYAADNGDLFWTFSWKKGHMGSSYPDLRNPPDYRRAVMYQAVDILRRRAIPEMPVVEVWVSNILYNHLPLIEYVDAEMPDFNLIAPHDGHRLRWARDPAGFAEGAFLPFQPEPTVASQRWVYTSSYDLPPAFFDRSEPFARIYPLGSSHLFSPTSDSILGAWAVSDVSFPAQKVHVFDRVGVGPGGGRQFALFDDSRTPALMVDGAAREVTTADTNPGWRPNAPRLETPSRMIHEPYAWEPGPSGMATGHYRWTRGGIEGRDFGGPEVDTGQP